MIKLLAAALASIMCLASLPVPVQAQTTIARTFVSGKGADTGSCALATPCRSFAYAINQTSAGGEIVALDSAGYGQVVVTKAITISAPPGVEAVATLSRVQVGTNAAVLVQAGSSDEVMLSGLTLDGLGSGSDGVVVETAGNIDIVNCLARNFSDAGVVVDSGNSHIVGMTILNVRTGIIYPYMTSNSQLLKNAVIEATLQGVVVHSGTVTILGLTATGSANADIETDGGSIYLSNSSIGSISTTGATIYSYGNNTITGAVSGGGSLTPMALR